MLNVIYYILLKKKLFVQIEEKKCSEGIGYI